MFFNGTFVRRQNGAHARAAAQLDFLTRTFERVVVYSFSNHPTCPWTATDVDAFRHDYPEVELVLEDQSLLMRLATRAKNILIPFAPRLAGHVVRARVPLLAPIYQRLLKRKPAMPVLVNYVDGLTQLNGLEPARAVVETHDVKFANFAKIKHRRMTDFRVLQKLRSEIAALDTARAVIAISPSESHYFRTVLCEAEVVYVPEYSLLDNEMLAPTLTEVRYDLLFVASDNIFNVEGFKRFVSHNDDWLSHFRVGVCGLICQVPEIISLASSRGYLHLLGFMDDLAQVYAATRACISPGDGTGLKIKVVEALRNRKPVLASTESMAGLPPGYEGCVFPLERSQVEKLLTDKDALRSAEREIVTYLARLGNTGELTRLQTILTAQ